MTNFLNFLKHSKLRGIWYPRLCRECANYDEEVKQCDIFPHGIGVPEFYKTNYVICPNFERRRLGASSLRRSK